MLKLVQFSTTVQEKDSIYDVYFSHSSMAQDKLQRYDPDRRCYYFDTMEEALSVREDLKRHFEIQIKRGNYHGQVPMYDVISDMIPWYEADFSRKTIQSYANSENSSSEAIVVPGDFQNVEELIDYIEMHSAGDSDKDDGPTGEEAIHLAESGLGTLRRLQNGTTIPISIEEAKEIAKEDPDSIVLVFDAPF